MNWHQKTTAEAALQAGTSIERGLEAAEAARRLAENGPNELAEQGRRSPGRILWEQLTATMVLVLMAAAGISAALGEFKDAVAIGAIVLLFALLGFVQEYRAERAMAALRRLAAPAVRVRRDGRLQEIRAPELVVGDVVALEAGNLVPADLRIVESVNLRIQEAALTGEAEAVEKSTEALDYPDLPLGDRANMAYLGTTVTYGRGLGLVVATGMQTELGRIAALLQGVRDEQTPLQRRLNRLGKQLAAGGLGVAALIFGLGVLRGEPLRDMLLTAVSLAVAVVPEGLPAVVTITLALGAQRMLARQALIRKLPAVETLGSVTVICSDKTGTLTENRMTVTLLDVAGHQVELTEELRRHMPALTGLETHLFGEAPQAVTLLLVGGALCNDATLRPGSEPGRFETLGDPTEAALLVAAARGQIYKESLQSWLPRRGEVPFDSDRKRMTTLHSRQGAPDELAPGGLLTGAFGTWAAAPHLAFTKGAVDGLLEISNRVWVNDHAEPLTEAWRQRVEAANLRLASQGMRVLGVAFRPLEDWPALETAVEQDLILIGMVGMIDPPRPEVRAAVSTCQAAGIRPVMITGDHPLTARQIARDLGIISDEAGPVLTGQDLSRLSDEDLAAVVGKVAVYARVSPEHKLRIVQALQQRGEIVAMTGDGVNDAPALKRADIGVAMGITGTDVAKEAAAMVLRDDNFATIVAAVEEGRTIFDNLRKFVKFSVAGNIGKVAVMLLAPLLDKPLPLAPLQLLWLNLLTDGLLGLGLGVEPPERDVMQRPPHAPQAGIFSQGMGRQVLWVGTLIGALALGIGFVAFELQPEGAWQTMIFTTLAFAQLGQALASRSRRDSLFQTGLRSNPAGMALAVSVGLLQLAVVYVPFLQRFFNTQPLAPAELAVCMAAGLVVWSAMEVEKWLARRGALRSLEPALRG